MRHHNHACSFVSGWITYVQIRRKAGWEFREVLIAGNRCNGASSVRILIPGTFILPVIPDLVNHLRGHSQVRWRGWGETGNESNTNRMVHEEQGIVRRPRRPLITVRGASTVGTEAAQVASEIL